MLMYVYLLIIFFFIAFISLPTCRYVTLKAVANRLSDTGSIWPSSVQISGVVTEPPEKPTNILFENYPSSGIEENLPIGSLIADLKSVDASTTDDTGTFTLISGSSCKVSGARLLIAKLLSYEDGFTRICNVRVTDMDGLTMDVSLTIKLLNVNEAPTSLQMSQYNIDEEQVDTRITLTTSDPDNIGLYPQRQTFSYNLLGPAGYFKLNSNSPGILLMRQKVDYEAISVKKLSVQIKVTDSGIPSVGTRGAQKVLTSNIDIQVNDVNESPYAIVLVHREDNHGWVKKDTEATIYEW